VSMPGVMLGHRYVATPTLHEARIVDDSSGFARQRGTFLTIYTLCGDPADAFDDMTVLRDQLYEGGRMRFPADKKAVREGDVLDLQAATPTPGGALLPADVPFVGHTGIVVVQRRSDEHVEAWYRDQWAPAVAALDGVHGVVSFFSRTRQGLALDLVFVEGDAAVITQKIRAEAPHHDNASIVLDAPFDLIVPLHYPWMDAIRDSALPKSVA